MYKIKITSKGQINLPKVLREKLNLRDGDYLDASFDNNKILLKPLPHRSSKDVTTDYCKNATGVTADLEKTRTILNKVPFSLSERVSKLRPDGS
jgi:AbrB family looped-hinge helix DNA binding protein